MLLPQPVSRMPAMAKDRQARRIENGLTRSSSGASGFELGEFAFGFFKVFTVGVQRYNLAEFFSRMCAVTQPQVAVTQLDLRVVSFFGFLEFENLSEGGDGFIILLESEQAFPRPILGIVGIATLRILCLQLAINLHGF